MSNNAQTGFRLSPQQKRLWLLQLLYPQSAFLAQAACAISGPLDSARLRSALASVVARHEILRTSYNRPTGHRLPLQVINEEMEIVWSESEKREGGKSREQRVEGMLREERREMEGRQRREEVRGRLEKVDEEESVLVISVRGMSGDGGSAREMVREVAREYGGRREESEEEVGQYADLAEVFNELLEADDADSRAGKEYWLRQSSALGHASRLPFEKRAAQPAFLPGSISLSFDREARGRIEACAIQHKASVEVFLAACWQALLCRLTGAQEMTIAHAFDCRSHEDLRNVLGLFTRWLPITTHIEDGDRIGDIAARIGEAAESASAFQEYFFWDQSSLPPEQPDGVNYFAVSFEYEDWSEQFTQEAVTFSLANCYACTEPFKLKLRAIRRGEDLITDFQFDSTCFASADVERLGRYFHFLVNSVIAKPELPLGQIPLLDSEERHRLVTKVNATHRECSLDTCVHQLFEKQARLSPGRIAVVYEKQELTYSELNVRANRLARMLVRIGVRPEDRVAVCLERSVEMLVGILGIMKAGGAYVPLDPMLPQARLSFMLRDADVKAVLSQYRLADQLAAHELPTVYLDRDIGVMDGEADVAPEVGGTAGNLAYVIYTSGSTGQPKGVTVEHRQLVNYLHNIVERLSLPGRANYALVTTIAADLGHTGTFSALCNGGTLHVISQEAASNPGLLAEYFRHHRIDCLKISPSHLNALLGACNTRDILPRQRLILGGETSSWALIERVQSLFSDCRIFNHYGPTETTVGVLTFEVKPSLDTPASVTVPLGRPLANTQIYILDANLHLVPEGIAGEVFIGGDSLARGYLNRPDITAERFIPNPYSDQPGMRLYKTGDLAHYLADGNVEFLGRLDHQIKVRGYRVESKEVEMALLQHDAIKEAAVIAQEDKSGNQILVAFVVGMNGRGPGSSELRRHLQEMLPEYMVPSLFISLKSLPLTLNGKLDREALPDTSLHQAGLEEAYIAPRSDVEQAIAATWQEVLPVDRVGLYDNFFDLGGHSLSMIRVHSRLLEIFNKDVPIIDLFKYTTVNALAKYLSEAPAMTPSFQQSHNRAETRRTAINRQRALRKAI
jgi:amino acid adenylation domain-containing protein